MLQRPNISISNESDGDMRYKLQRYHYLAKNKITKHLLILGKQTHSCNIAHVKYKSLLSNNDFSKSKYKEVIFPQTDGFISQERQPIVIGIYVADCYPVFIWESKTKSLIGLHLGWRAIKENFIRESIYKANTNQELQIKKLSSWIGPGICRNHFEVNEDVFAIFFDIYPTSCYKKDGSLFVDLRDIIQIQLTSLGILKENITTHQDCSFCNQKYYSYRRQGAKVGRMLALSWWY